MYLAELNIARLLAPKDDPKVAPFMNALDTINGIAERSDGYIWRLKDDGGNATNIVFSDDDQIISNVSVWRDLVSLEHFVWNTLHKTFFERKHEWFEVFGGSYFVMWWVEEGHQPTIEEAREKLAILDKNGASEEAFDWKWIKSQAKK